MPDHSNLLNLLIVSGNGWDDIYWVKFDTILGLK